MTKVMIAKVRSEILEESKTELVIEKNGNTYVGALFFQLDEYDETVEEVLEAIEIDGEIETTKCILFIAYELKKKYGMLAKDDKSFLSMAHWQYMNGFSDDMFLDGYSYKTDTEWFNAMLAR